MEQVLTQPIRIVLQEPVVVRAPALELSHSRIFRKGSERDWFDRWYPLLLPLSLAVNALATFSVLGWLF